jgi:hypothetical protein
MTDKQDGMTMEEVSGDVMICDGNDEPVMNMCRRDDREAMWEGVPVAP